MHHGQVCFSTERIVVQKKVAEPFTKAPVAAVKNLDAQSFAGIAVSQGITEHALVVLQEAKTKGVRFIVGDTAHGSSCGFSLLN